MMRMLTVFGLSCLLSSVSASAAGATNLVTEEPPGAGAVGIDPFAPGVSQPDVEAKEDGVDALPRMPVTLAPATLAVVPNEVKARSFDSTVGIRRPKYRGTGLFIAAGSLYASALVFQGVDLLLCDGACAIGFVERGFLGSSLVLAPIGASLRATSDAWHDAALRRPVRATKSRRTWGVLLTTIGIAGGIANEIMWWQCVRNGTGPYALSADGWTECRALAPRLALDASAAMATGGLGMLAWSVRYRRDAQAYARAELSIRPQVGPSQTGLTLTGRF